jgi:hypothetical protein
MLWNFLDRRKFDTRKPYYGGTSHAAPVGCLVGILILFAAVVGEVAGIRRYFSEPTPPAATVRTLPPAAAQP